MSGELAIIRGAAIPPLGRSGGRGRAESYPWDKLGVGDSFIVPFRRAKTASVRWAVSAAAERTGHRYTTRVVATGTQVWRVG